MHRLTVFRCLYASRTASESASPQAVANLVGRLWNDSADAPTPQVGTDGA